VGKHGLTRGGVRRPLRDADVQVSCIIPAFNAAAYVGAAVESILQQTHPPREVLVVDDGSTDKTASVVEAFGPRVTLLSRPHGGAAGAKNAALEVARGPYVAFLDADDVWVRDKLARQLAHCATRPDIDLCFTAYDNFWISELADEAVQYSESKLSQTSNGWSVSTLLTRLSVFGRFGLFAAPGEAGEKYHNLLWALNAAALGAVVDVLPDVLMHRRLHHTNVSRSWAIDDQFIALVKAWRDYQKRAGKDGKPFGGDDADPALE
jgi:glycosyltransferase involved in cell wall biosynthesis